MVRIFRRSSPRKWGKHPQNSNLADKNSVCYKSFKNVININDVVVHHQNGSFLNIIYPALDIESFKTVQVIKLILKNSNEYFIVILTGRFNESGSSIAAGSLDVINAGTAYRIHGWEV